MADSIYGNFLELKRIAEQAIEERNQAVLLLRAARKERDCAIELQGSAEARMQDAQMRQIGLREERDVLLSAIKQHRQATESRLRLLDSRGEAAKAMLKPDRDLYEALGEFEAS